MVEDGGWYLGVIINDDPDVAIPCLILTVCYISLHIVLLAFLSVVKMQSA
jgi:hypothetical protein